MTMSKKKAARPWLLIERKEGWKFEIIFAEYPENKFPAKAYWMSQDDRVKARFARLFMRFAEHGKIENIHHFQNLGDGILEFKHTRPHRRIFAFYSEHKKDRLVLSHGFDKQTNKTPQAEIEKAKIIRNSSKR